MHFTGTFASANKGDLFDNKQTLFQFLLCCQAKIIKSTLWETRGLLGTILYFPIPHNALRLGGRAEIQDGGGNREKIS